MTAYGQSGTTGAYEYDHLVPLEIGGATNWAANLWPEPLDGPYGARVKDALENELHDLVCSGRSRCATAQEEVASDWVAAYVRYRGSDRVIGAPRRTGRGGSYLDLRASTGTSESATQRDRSAGSGPPSRRRKMSTRER